jgi:radical SAM protein (TIGR01212 family)
VQPPEAPLINTFSHHCRQKYGEPVGKLPIDVGLVCPNREQGGCIFCRPAGFTAGHLQATDQVLQQVKLGKKHLIGGRFKRYLAYFQQETCTALPREPFLAKIQMVLEDPDCLGLIISTRPDHIPDALLTELASRIGHTGKDCLFELGMQTAHERSLQLLNRNHTFAEVKDGIRRIKAATPFATGVHLIFGIPGESENEMLDSLTAACDLGIDALKLHHLQVIRDTPLHGMYTRGEVELFTLEGYMSFLLRALPHIPARVVLHRLWATAHPDLLVAPNWHILATQLSGELLARMRQQGIRQGESSVVEPFVPRPGD